VRFVWTPRNQEKVKRHGLDREIVEAVFEAPDMRVAVESPSGRGVAEGTVEGRCVRVIFSFSGPDEAYPITAYPVNPTRRKT